MHQILNPDCLSAQAWDVNHSVPSFLHSLRTHCPQSQAKQSCCWHGLEQYKLWVSIFPLRLIINSSKVGGLTSRWIFNVTAQDKWGNQILPAESRLSILEHTCACWGHLPHLAHGSQAPLRKSGKFPRLNQATCSLGQLDGDLSCPISFAGS